MKDRRDTESCPTIIQDRDNFERTNAYKAQILSLKSQIQELTTTIHKLEGSVTENYNFKVLSEQNDMLRDEVESYRFVCESVEMSTYMHPRQTRRFVQHRPLALPCGCGECIPEKHAMHVMLRVGVCWGIRDALFQPSWVPVLEYFGISKTLVFDFLVAEAENYCSRLCPTPSSAGPSHVGPKSAAPEEDPSNCSATQKTGHSLVVLHGSPPAIVESPLLLFQKQPSCPKFNSRCAHHNGLLLPLQFLCSGWVGGWLDSTRAVHDVSGGTQ